MDDTLAPIGPGDLAVTVEMGDEFVPGSRTAAAFAELVDALAEEHGDEVSGFQLAKPDEIRSFDFASRAIGDTKMNFYEGWPCKWKMNSFDGKGND